MPTISDVIVAAKRLQKAATALVKNTSNRNRSQWLELSAAQADMAIVLAKFGETGGVAEPENPLPDLEPAYDFIPPFTGSAPRAIL